MKNPKFDNLFDKKVTFLDVIKFLLLVVTLFSTWNIISLITPPSPLAWVRIVAAVGVVEGAFLGFEFATSAAKTRQQTQYATIGFFCSLAVIAIFAAVSGFLEFAGPGMLATPLGSWMGLDWTARSAVEICALATVVSWIVVLASLYRLYALADPDKQAELIRTGLSGDVTNTANNALRQALEVAKPRVAIERALGQIQHDFEHELTPDQMQELKRDVKANLMQHYAQGAAPAQGVARPSSLGVNRVDSGVEPLHSFPTPNLPRTLIGSMGSNGNGNGHHKTDENFTA